MKKLFQVICLSGLASLIVFAGCKKKEDPKFAFEYEMTGMKELKSDTRLYICVDKSSSENYATDQEVTVPPFPVEFSSGWLTMEFTGATLYIHTGTTCNDLGMTDVTAGNINWHTNPASMFSPGSSSHWASGGSGVPSFCDDPYVSPYTDPQVNPYCQMAYMYRCQGLSLESTQVKTNCDTWANWRIQDPSIPACPYCQ